MKRLSHDDAMTYINSQKPKFLKSTSNGSGYVCPSCSTFCNDTDFIRHFATLIRHFATLVRHFATVTSYESLENRAFEGDKNSC